MNYNTPLIFACLIAAPLSAMQEADWQAYKKLNCTIKELADAPDDAYNKVAQLKKLLDEQQSGQYAETLKEIERQAYKLNDIRSRSMADFSTPMDGNPVDCAVCLRHYCHDLSVRLQPKKLYEKLFEMLDEIPKAKVDGRESEILLKDYMHELDQLIPLNIEVHSAALLLVLRESVKTLSGLSPSSHCSLQYASQVSKEEKENISCLVGIFALILKRVR